MKIANTISGDNISLRPLTTDDLPLKVQWYNDPDIRKTLVVDEVFELQKTIEWFETIRDSKTRLDLIIETPQAEPIGTIGLVNIDARNATAEIFIVIGNKDFWAKGVMLQAESLLIDYSFKELHLEKIWAHVRTDNIASVVTMKKLGFQLEGTLRQHVLLEGVRKDLFFLGVLKDQFKPAETEGR